MDRFQRRKSEDRMQMKKCVLTALILVLGWATGTGILFAQATASGTVQGTVFDASQAVIAGAEVGITSVTTGSKRTMNTNNTGNYRFDLLPAGAYKLTVSSAGFSTAVQNIELLVGQTATANITLAPGATTQTVEVAGSNPLVDVLKTSVSDEITPTEVEALPMVGRDVANLAYLAPGVKAADSYDPTKNRYAILSVNGDGGRNVNVTVNGVDNKDNTVGGPVMQLPLEAVEEFKISTQRFSAVNGKTQGAAINMITKSGSNTLHGSAFGVFRDQAFNALNYFEKTENGGTGQKSPYSRQVFGGSFGAPIIKDKLFGFFALERQRESTSLAETPFAFDQLSLVTALGAEPASTIPTPFYEWRYN